MPQVDWSSFLSALSARGCSFSDVQLASDRKALIQSLGISDPIDVAVIETMWNAKMNSNSNTTTNNNNQAPSQQQTAFHTNTNTNTNANTNLHGISSWHRVDPNRLRTEPEEVQDYIIAEELSFALRGISGSIIKFNDSTTSSTTSNTTPGGDSKPQSPSSPTSSSSSSQQKDKKVAIIAPSLPTSTTQMIHHALRNTLSLFYLEQHVCRHEYTGSSLIRGAVGEAVREVCAAYVRTIADLQEKISHASFSLSRLCTEAETCGYAVRRLAQLFQTITDPVIVGSLPQAPDGGGLTGPWLLNALHMQYNRAIGNPDDEKILGLILKRASRPYLKMLFDWMHRGELKNDPFKEFFVIDTSSSSSGGDESYFYHRNKNTNNNENNNHYSQDGESSSNAAESSSRDAIDRWENRFQLVTRQVPHFLAQNKIYKQVHTSGKYCHMLRECAVNDNIEHQNNKTTAMMKVGTDSASSSAAANQNKNELQQQQQSSSSSSSELESDELLFEWGDAGKLERAVHHAHTAASTNVLRMLVSQHRLLDRLKSLRLYFFIAHGDWLVNFLDTAKNLLQRPAPEVKTYSLNVLLQSSITKSCSGKEDSSHCFTRCSLSDVNLFQAVELSRKRDPSFTNVHRGTFLSSSSSSQQNQNQNNNDNNLFCFELLQLEVASEWPLSLILNDIFVTRLNFAFRLLLRFKVCERALHSVLWHQHQTSNNNNQQRQNFGFASASASAASKNKKSSNNKNKNERSASSTSSNANTNFFSIEDNGLAVSLRSQLLQFVRQFQFYAAHEVLEPSWKQFLAKVEMAPGINHIGSASSELCQTIMRGLAITSEHGLKILWSILDICLNFSQFMNQLNMLQQQQQQQQMQSSSPTGDSAQTNFQDQSLFSNPQQIRAKLVDWQNELYRLLTELADPNQPDSTNLLQMLVWLDFNGFYEKLGVYKVRHAAVRHDRMDDYHQTPSSGNAGAAGTTTSSSATSGGGRMSGGGGGMMMNMNDHHVDITTNATSSSTTSGPIQPPPPRA